MLTASFEGQKPPPIGSTSGFCDLHRAGLWTGSLLKAVIEGTEIPPSPGTDGEVLKRYAVCLLLLFDLISSKGSGDRKQVPWVNTEDHATSKIQVPSVGVPLPQGTTIAAPLLGSVSPAGGGCRIVHLPPESA